MDEKLEGFFHDDGTSVNSDLIPKPSLCVSCKHDSDPEEEIPCMLNRIDQQGEGDFKCEVYEKK